VITVLQERRGELRVAITQERIRTGPGGFPDDEMANQKPAAAPRRHVREAGVP
jgi:hypothetical protein